jgi:aspartate kinase
MEKCLQETLPLVSNSREKNLREKVQSRQIQETRCRQPCKGQALQGDEEDGDYQLSPRDFFSGNCCPLVLKFGGAAVATPESFSHVAEIILARKKTHPRIVIVVSAMGDTTDQLIALAKRVHPNPPKREYDMLVTVGERVSISLLAMALAAKGQEAVSFTGSQSGIITTSCHSDAKIIDVRPQRLQKSLDEGRLVIVAGFQGVSQDKEITTLGRGGSDTTAVALGVALKASRVEFYKDVRGIYDEDPEEHPEAHFCPSLNYEEALDILDKGCGVLHRRSLLLAWRNQLPLWVTSFHAAPQGTEGTSIEGSVQEKGGSPLYEEASSCRV